MNENECSADARADQSQPERSRHPIGTPTLQRAVAFKDERGRWWIRLYHRCGGWYEEPADELRSMITRYKTGTLCDKLIKWYRYRLVWGRRSLGVGEPNVYPGRSCFAFWSEQHA